MKLPKLSLSAEKTMTAAFVFAGAFARVQEYLYNRSFWYDEAKFALNIVYRSFSGYFSPLDFSSVAPIGFLLLVELCEKLFGNFDYVLRLVPLISGLLSIFLFKDLLDQFLETKAKFIALAFMCLSPFLIFYSTEFKQYSTEVLVTILILRMGVYYLERPLTFLRACQFGVFGSLALWFSLPGMFVLGGVGAAYIAIYVLEKRFKELKLFSVCVLLWSATLAVFYLLVYSYSRGKPYFYDYFRDFFLPFPIDSFEKLGVYCDAPLYYVREIMLIQKRCSIGFLTVCLGTASFLISSRKKFLLLVFPLLFYIVFSMAQIYPIYVRLGLFSLPITFILFAKGFEVFFKNKYKFVRFLGLLLAVYLLPFSKFAYIFEQAPRPHQTARFDYDIKSLLLYMKKHIQSEDVIYLPKDFYPAFEYYASQFELENYKYVVGPKLTDSEEWGKHSENINLLSKYKRVWLMVSFDKYYWDTLTLKKIKEKFTETHDPLKWFRTEVTSVYLYELKKNE